MATLIKNIQDSNGTDHQLDYTALGNLPTIPTVTDTYSETGTDAVSGKAVASAISGKEATSNKVTSLSSSSTDTEYPSAKCVYDLMGDVESILNTING